MHYISALLTVRDLPRARRFYCELLGMEVTADYGANITLSHAISLQTLATWQDFLQLPQEEITLGGRAAELYFEEADLDGFLNKLAAWPGLELVHPLKEHAWGQRAVRFYDPDRHIIEVGEKMTAVARRFYDGGMTPAQVAKRMDVPQEAVDEWLAQTGGQA